MPRTLLDRAKGSLAAELRAGRAMEVRLRPGRTLGGGVRSRLALFDTRGGEFWTAEWRDGGSLGEAISIYGFDLGFHQRTAEKIPISSRPSV